MCSPPSRTQPAHHLASEINTGVLDTPGPGPLFLVDNPETVKDPASEQGRRCFTIDVLSDDDLLHIFSQGFYPDDAWPWHTLLHVCQRWRQIIFARPYHFDLRLDCKSEAAIVKALDVWPALPISIQSELNHKDGDGIISALEEHRDRIARVDLSGLTGPQLEKCAALMKEPFLVLRTLSLGSDGCVCLPPGDLSGGPASHLQMLKLSNNPFTALPNLPLSASSLVELHFAHHSSTGYISPDAMATCMSMLTRLRFVRIIFRYGGSFLKHRTNRCSTPLTRSVLPALASLEFEGDSEYLEELIARIDAPHLVRLSLIFFYQAVFDAPQQFRFIHDSEIFKSPLLSTVEVSPQGIEVTMLSSRDDYLFLKTHCSGLDTQLSWARQICTQLLPLLFHIDELHLWSDYDTQLHRQDSMLWLEILSLFSDVLVVSACGGGLEVDIARVLGGLPGERAIEMLPMLQSLELGRFDDVKPLLKPFIDARQLSDHPVVVC